MEVPRGPPQYPCPSSLGGCYYPYLSHFPSVGLVMYRRPVPSPVYFVGVHHKSPSRQSSFRLSSPLQRQPMYVYPGLLLSVFPSSYADKQQTHDPARDTHSMSPVVQGMLPQQYTQLYSIWTVNASLDSASPA